MARRSSVSAIKSSVGFPSENACAVIYVETANLPIPSLFFLQCTIDAPFTNFQARQRLKKTQ